MDEAFFLAELRFALEAEANSSRSCINADAVTATAVISALSQLGNPELAHCITDYIDREGIEQNEYVITALV
ncbi:hypothetical protein Dimus_004668 [Dionaea muscipula]